MTITCSCNGFPLPLLCNDALEVTKLGENRPPLGWFDGPVAPKQTYPMPESGCLVMFSDGLAELDAGNDMLCPLALSDAVLDIKPDESTCADILQKQRDDVFVQRVCWAPKSEDGDRLLRPLFHSVCTDDESSNVDACQQRWENVLKTSLQGLSADRRMEIVLSCREAALNAIEHGSKCVTKRACKVTMAVVGCDVLRVCVRDEAGGPPSAVSTKPDHHIPFGMKIIKGYADLCRYDTEHHALVLEFFLDAHLKRASRPNNQP